MFTFKIAYSIQLKFSNVYVYNVLRNDCIGAFKEHKLHQAS